MKKRELTDRWAEPLVDTIAVALANGTQISATPFGLIDGRIDLRCISLQSRTIRGAVLKDIDLSHADLSNCWIESATCENVVLTSTALNNLSDQGNQFIGCRFEKTSMRGAQLGYLGSKYNSCEFIATDFRKAGAIRPEFDNCLFADCNLKGFDFNASSFVQCVFKGKLEDVWFHGGFLLPHEERQFGKPRKNRMEDVSFEDANLVGVTFSDGCDLSSIVLPRKGEYRQYDHWKRRLEFLLQSSNDWPDDIKSEATAFADVHLVHAESQDWFLLNCDELRSQYCRIAGNLVIETLDRALCIH